VARSGVSAAGCDVCRNPQSSVSMNSRHLVGSFWQQSSLAETRLKRRFQTCQPSLALCLPYERFSVASIPVRQS